MAIRKKFIEVDVPILNEEMSLLGTPESLNNRTIKLDLSRKLRGRGMEITLVIKNDDGKLTAHPKKMLLMRNYIQKMMRKRISYVEDSFKASCKDIEVTIKPFLITRNRVSRAIRNNLRRTTKTIILEYIKEKCFIEIANDILQNNLQKELHPKLKKIYPLSLCEIRVFETTQLDKADLNYKIQKEAETTQAIEEKEELTQAEEIELEQAKKAKEKKEKVVEEESEEEKPKKKKSTKKKEKSE